MVRKQQVFMERKSDHRDEDERDGWRIRKVDGGQEWKGMEDKGKCLELIVDSEIDVDVEINYTSSNFVLSK